MAFEEVKDYYTKEEYLESIFRDIKDKATRKNRGAQDNEYLISDLELIEQLTERGRIILASDQKEYHWMEIKRHDMQVFKEGLQKR